MHLPYQILRLSSIVDPHSTFDAANAALATLIGDVARSSQYTAACLIVAYPWGYEVQRLLLQDSSGTLTARQWASVAENKEEAMACRQGLDLVKALPASHRDLSNKVRRLSSCSPTSTTRNR